LNADFIAAESSSIGRNTTDVNTITLVMVINRWPQTLDSALTVLDPFVCKKVAIVDKSPNFARLSRTQRGHFDAVRYTEHLTLDRLRNASLELARELAEDTWALVVDTDEFVEAQSLVRLCQAIAPTSEVCAFLLPVYNYVGHGRWTTSYSFRLFRLNRPIEYRYEIHESISPSLVRNNLHWQYVNAAIQHLDFIKPVAGKRLRYKALLAKAIEKGEDLAFLKTLYAAECFWSGEYVSALRHLDDAIGLADDPAGNSRFGGRDDFPLALKAQYLVHGRELSQAEALFKRLYEKAEARVAAEAALGLAYIAGIDGDNSTALEWINASLARWESSEAVFSRATVFADLEQPQSALRDISHGLRLNPMAGDARILGEPNPESIFGGQSLLHPNYQGLPKLLQKVMRKHPGPIANDDVS
jgi:tetratricopeptide (TPR) repeat protein